MTNYIFVNLKAGFENKKIISCYCIAIVSIYRKSVYFAFFNASRGNF